jgi:hypothetical protein
MSRFLRRLQPTGLLFTRRAKKSIRINSADKITSQLLWRYSLLKECRFNRSTGDVFGWDFRWFGGHRHFRIIHG